MLKTNTLEQLAEWLNFEIMLQVARLDTVMYSNLPSHPSIYATLESGQLLLDTTRLPDVGIDQRTGDLLKACVKFEKGNKPLSEILIATITDWHDLRETKLYKYAFVLPYTDADPIDEPEYYIAGEYDDIERSPFVVICSRYIDGNIADVYGDTLADAKDQAKLIVDLLNNGVIQK